jgi:DNA-binding CsgD family transcriptional regulator
MLRLTAIPYIPTVAELKILLMFSLGYTLQQIATECKVTYAAISQRVYRLRIKIGAASNEHMMCEYGKYLERNKK